jgi:hypothetical protein
VLYKELFVKRQIYEKINFIQGLVVGCGKKVGKIKIVAFLFWIISLFGIPVQKE